MNDDFDAAMGVIPAPKAGPDVLAIVRAKASQYGLDPDMAERWARQESGLNPKATSKKGARGVLQLMPATAKQYGVADSYDAETNIDGGMRYLSDLKRKYGDDTRAFAAYNAGPKAVDKAGGVPNYPETQAYVRTIVGGGQAHDDFDVVMTGAHDAGVAAGAGPVVDAEAAYRVAFGDSGKLAAKNGKGAPGISDAALTGAQEPSQAAPRKDQILGLQKGFFTPFDKAALWLEHGMDKAGGLGTGFNRFFGGTSVEDAMAQRKAYLADQAAKGVQPGMAGEFVGNVLGTAPIPGGPLVQGAVGGALLSNAKDPKGLLADTLMGGAAGRLTALGSDALQLGARRLLSKAPSIMDMPALEGAVKAAYAKVDASGFKIPRSDMRVLADEVVAHLREKGGPKGAKLYADADAFVARLRELATQKDGVSVSKLDTLRSDIYEALIKPGGKEAGIGKTIRAKIDGLIDSIPNGDIKTARELYMRLSKLRTVTNALDSGELRNASTFTGKNADNVIRQKLRPLLDPTSGRRIANATADEMAALRNAITGTRGQNVIRTIGTMLDPRGIIGAAVQTGAGVKTAGASLPSILLGMAATKAGNRATEKNADDLLRLIAAGGSKQALARTATKTSQAVENRLVRARPALVAAAVPALAAMKKPDRPRK